MCSYRSSHVTQLGQFWPVRNCLKIRKADGNRGGTPYALASTCTQTHTQLYKLKTNPFLNLGKSEAYIWFAKDSVMLKLWTLKSLRNWEVSTDLNVIQSKKSKKVKKKLSLLKAFHSLLIWRHNYVLNSFRVGWRKLWSSPYIRIV